MSRLHSSHVADMHDLPFTDLREIVMRAYSALAIRLCCCAAVLVSACSFAAENNVSGVLNLGNEKIELKNAYVDLVQPTEPIIVLSDQPLPASAIPFIPEKLVTEKNIHAIAFSVSAKDRAFPHSGMLLLHIPGHGQVGMGNAEDGNIKLVISRLDGSRMEGTIATTKVVHVVESVPPYSFALKFAVDLGK
jgi:hypothetical protein